MRTLQSFNVFVGCADARRRINRDRCASRCSAHPIYSLSAGQYFDVKIEYVDITREQFAEKMRAFNDNLDSLFGQSRELELEVEIKKQLAGLKYE
ncbi:hypothetical protein JCM14076_07140 [Methylosoma difficile]